MLVGLGSSKLMCYTMRNSIPLYGVLVPSTPAYVCTVAVVCLVAQARMRKDMARLEAQRQELSDRITSLQASIFKGSEKLDQVHSACGSWGITRNRTCAGLLPVSSSPAAGGSRPAM